MVELVLGDEDDSASALEDEAFAALAGVVGVRRDAGTIRLSVTDTQAAIAALFDLLEARGLTLEDLRTHRPTLEDVFVTLTGKHLRDD